ncbi:MAG: patatin-like phospholipase family protein [Bacteroidota bacterium]
MKTIPPFIIFVFLLISCTDQFMVIEKPEKMPPPHILVKKPRVALALGGGAFHGPAHVGVIKALEENNIPIDFIAGASAGSLVGAMYADQPNADSLMRFVNTKARQIFDFSLFRSKEGFISGKKLQKYIEKSCHARNIEDLKIPFAAVATDLISGQSIVLTSGPIAPSVNASCAIPFVFEPVKMYGKLLVDGGVLNNVPADICRETGAEIVIAVDIMALGDSTKEIDNMVKTLMRALVVASGQLKAEKISKADLLIVPNLKGIPYMSGARNKDAYDSGYVAAMRVMPQIRELMIKHGLIPVAK